jgi:hypothetical protein
VHYGRMTSNKFAAFLFVVFVANSLCLFFIVSCGQIWSMVGRKQEQLRLADTQSISFQNVVFRLSTCWLLFCIISRIHVCMILPNILRIIWIQLWRLESLQNVHR